MASTRTQLRLTVGLLFSMCVTASPQYNSKCDSQAADSSSPECALQRLSALADDAHKVGHIDQEIVLRRQFSREAWAVFAKNPNNPGRFNRWDIIHFNDLPLALLLEGTHQWTEAEAVYRHNQKELEHERLAGNDIKSNNQLHLAHLLSAEGNTSEATSICAHWKRRVKHIADVYLKAVKTNIPTPPLYDTPEVEIGKWNLACGNQQEGLRLLTLQIAEHPDMLAPYTVLAQHYLATGDFDNARKAESMRLGSSE